MKIKSKTIDLIRLVCETYKVNKLYIFGSVLTENFTEDSDIDFLVKFGDVELYHYFDNFMGFKEELEKILNRPVDLVEEQTVKNPFLKTSIDRNKKLIYGREDQKVVV